MSHNPSQKQRSRGGRGFLGANYGMELTRASRSDQSEFVSPWRLAWVAHPDCWARFARMLYGVHS